MTTKRHFVSLGMFIIDEFKYLDEQERPTERKQSPQIGGGGTYACIGARMWLPAEQIGMIVDRGHDFPPAIQTELDSFGDMWLFRDDGTRQTTAALNIYKGDHRGFKYLTPRLRLTPRDLEGTKLAEPVTIHFICSPSRAIAITNEIRPVEGWQPITIYEPIPDRCIPEELPALISVLPYISILSPNAEEALTILSMPLPPSRASIEQACSKFLSLGVGKDGDGYVIIRSGELGAYAACRGREGKWIDAFWTPNDSDKIVDVTGAGNSFLGGLSAGLTLENGDVYAATFYANVTASFTIEQQGLPKLSLVSDENGNPVEKWNDDSPQRRLSVLRARHS